MRGTWIYHPNAEETMSEKDKPTFRSRTEADKDALWGKLADCMWWRGKNKDGKRATDVGSENRETK